MFESSPALLISSLNYNYCICFGGACCLQALHTQAGLLPRMYGALSLWAISAKFLCQGNGSVMKLKVIF